MNPHDPLSLHLPSLLLVLTASLNTLLLAPPSIVASPVGPPYPVTAAWFQDHYSKQEWNHTLSMFQAQGGDTVVLRALPIIARTTEDLYQDPNFQWCGSYKSSTGRPKPLCWDEAEQELTALGLNVTSYLSYQYEENFTDSLMLCPQYDRKINSSRIYYRVVLPVGNTPYSPHAPCDFPKGSEVAVLFTSFAGTDPHEILVQTAAAKNISVFFGMPAAPLGFEKRLMPTYYAWADRVLREHKARYSSVKTRNNATLYDTIHGYYATDESCLGQVTPASFYTELYKTLGLMVKQVLKLFMISPYVNLNRSLLNSTVEQHKSGFLSIARTGVVDIIAVQEGRGDGKGCYYWPHQRNTSVALSDPVLDKIIRYLDPSVPPNVTFAQAFSASNQETFSAFQDAREELRAENPAIHVDLWLNVGAFEYIRDDPCLPIDPNSSGMGELINRASKARVDRGLSVAAAKVQKVISFAWDSNFVCTTKQYNRTLHSEIMSDLQRPMIANCSFHSQYNLSVVVLGFNLEGETQGFTVHWTDDRHHYQSTNVYGYYFELDYGARHNLVKSLEYVMLFDIPELTRSLAPSGTVRVKVGGGRDECVFQYDLPYDLRPKAIN